MGKVPKLRSLIKPQINICIEKANFTDDELQYFILKTKDKSNVYISLEMNISESQVSKLAKRVKEKISKLIEFNYW